MSRWLAAWVVVLVAGVPFVRGDSVVEPGQGRAAALTVPPQAELRPDAAASLNAPEAAVPTTQSFAEKTDEAIRRFAPIDYDVDARAKDLGAGVEPSFQFARDGSVSMSTRARSAGRTARTCRARAMPSIHRFSWRRCCGPRAFPSGSRWAACRPNDATC